MPSPLEALDHVRLNLSTGDVTIVNLTLGFIMFGVAIGIDTKDFTAILRNPRSVWVGLIGQWVILPALTLGIILIVNQWITVGIAMGLIMVASCPGGNISNFMVHLSKGNTALSVSLTAFSTLGSMLLTPITFLIWGTLYSWYASTNGDNPLLQKLSIDPIEVGKSVFLLLGLPLILGMSLRRYHLRLAMKLEVVMRWLSVAAFLVILGVAFSKNIDSFVNYIGAIFLLVLLHNAAIILVGYRWAKAWKLPQSDRRSVALEMGIQNTGLGLVLLLNPNIFPSDAPIGGMVLIAAWWGIWHIVSGLSTAFYWRVKTIEDE